MKMLTTIILALIFAAFVLAFIDVMTSTGPNCPGKDPTWQGWCSGAPVPQ